MVRRLTVRPVASPSDQLLYSRYLEDGIREPVTPTGVVSDQLGVALFKLRVAFFEPGVAFFEPGVAFLEFLILEFVVALQPVYGGDQLLLPAQQP
jgi:hypothetical protein